MPTRPRRRRAKALAAAEAAVTAAAAVAADITSSGLVLAVADTTVDTDDLDAAVTRLERADLLPAPLVAAFTEDVTTEVAAVKADVSGLRGSLDAAIAVKAAEEAAAQAQREAEAAAAAAAAEAAAAAAAAEAAAAAAAAEEAESSSSSGSASSAPVFAGPGTSAGEAQAIARSMMAGVRLGRRPVRLPRVAVGPGVGLELAGVQRVQRRVRHPAGPARQQDGLRRRRLADQRRHPDRVGPRLHRRPLRQPLRCMEPLRVRRLVLIRVPASADAGTPRAAHGALTKCAVPGAVRRTIEHGALDEHRNRVAIVGEQSEDALATLDGIRGVDVLALQDSEPALAARRIAAAGTPWIVHDADPLEHVAAAWVELFEERSTLGALEVEVETALALFEAGSALMPDYYIVLEPEGAPDTWRHWWCGALGHHAPRRVLDLAGADDATGCRASGACCATLPSSRPWPDPASWLPHLPFEIPDRVGLRD